MSDIDEIADLLEKQAKNCDYEILVSFYKSIEKVLNSTNKLNAQILLNYFRYIWLCIDHSDNENFNLTEQERGFVETLTMHYNEYLDRVKEEMNRVSLSKLLRYLMNFIEDGINMHGKRVVIGCLIKIRDIHSLYFTLGKEDLYYNKLNIIREDYLNFFKRIFFEKDANNMKKILKKIEIVLEDISDNIREEKNNKNNVEKFFGHLENLESYKDDSMTLTFKKIISNIILTIDRIFKNLNSNNKKDDSLLIISYLKILFIQVPFSSTILKCLYESSFGRKLKYNLLYLTSIGKEEQSSSLKKELWWNKCSDPIDSITLEKFTEDSDIIYIVSENQKILCYDRNSLIKWLETKLKNNDNRIELPPRLYYLNEHFAKKITQTFYNKPTDSIFVLDYDEKSGELKNILKFSELNTEQKNMVKNLLPFDDKPTLFGDEEKNESFEQNFLSQYRKSSLSKSKKSGIFSSSPTTKKRHTKKRRCYKKTRLVASKMPSEKIQHWKK